ncbi:MAG TPA: hypothetical protein VJT73_03465 [Polyangiaceae bacterium]|nr:hypothetical protein [Polyangiaceae bacterium]
MARTAPFPDRFSFALICALFASLFARSASAADRPTLAGTWNASPLIERFNIGDWGSACGPRPNARESPGGAVAIREEAAELIMSGVGRTFRTSECWEQLPNVSRASHSVSERAWKTRCTSAPNDARQTTLITTISATDTTISFDETGEYQFRIEGQNCTASVRRTRNFTLAQRQGAPVATVATGSTTAPIATAPAKVDPTPPVKNKCQEPGEPTRLEVRPSRKLMRPGERFTFRSTTLDANGCTVDTRPTWTLVTTGAKVTVSSTGAVTVADDALDGPVDVAAALAGKAVHVTVEIATPARYEALLSTASVNDAGENDEPATTVVATSSLGTNAAVAEDNAKTRKTTFLAIIGALAIGLAGLGFILLRRTPAKGSPEPDPSPAFQGGQTVAYMGPIGEMPRAAQPVVCPSCRNEFPPGSTFCPNDGNRLSAAAVMPPLGSSSSASGGICPTCGRGYDPGVKACPDHGDDLVPAAAYRAIAPRAVATAPRGKICPSCGGRYGGEATFCGKDGTALVLVN